MSLPPLRLLVLDTETTGFVPKVHRVMEYACALVENGKVAKEYETLLSLPADTQVPEAVQVLTRIFADDLNGKPSFEDIREEIAAMVTPDTVIVGQNIKFDIGMLRGEGWDLSEQPWIDTAMLASIVFPELPSYSLGYVSKALKLHHDPPHRALGDVRATVSFLEQCAKRLQELLAKDLARLQDYASKGPEGYKRFFAALSSDASATPAWLNAVSKTPTSGTPHPLSPPPVGTVALVPEPADRTYLPSVLTGLKKGQWCAVKNIEAAMGRHGELKNFTVLYPPELVLSQASAKALLSQTEFTADEMTMAMKLFLYKPAVRSDLPIHGDEYSVFSGKLASGSDGEEYKAMLASAAAGPTVLSHQHLLSLADAGEGIPDGTGVIIDDASMLEDTATAAYGWTCHLPSLRAAAMGHALLTKCADLVELWAERVRSDMDLRYLAPSDLDSKEASELRKVVEHVLGEDIQMQAKKMLSDLLLILDDRNLHGRFAWVETMQDNSKTIKSVPEDIGRLLADRLYTRTATTLLVPPASDGMLTPILPGDVPVLPAPQDRAGSPFTLSAPVGSSLDAILRSPSGKMIVLVPSKRVIEDVYVRHTEALENDGVTLLCQGFSGGLGRMQAEFAVATEPTIMVMTPWMYEGIDLQPETVDKLVLQSLPFDHPSHAVVSRRAQRYQNPFGEYSLPRLRFRLFRLLRTFSRHAKYEAVFEVLDDRLRSKAYGKEVAAYLATLASPLAAAPKAEAAGKPVRKKTTSSQKGEQMPLL